MLKSTFPPKVMIGQHQKEAETFTFAILKVEQSTEGTIQGDTGNISPFSFDGC